MMTPKRFRWSRARRVLSDSSRTSEILVAVCYVLVLGVMAVAGTTELPKSAAFYLTPFGWSEHRMGAMLIVFALAQCWSAGTDWYRARALVATGIAIHAALVALAYIAAGLEERAVVPSLMGTVLAETFLAWRCWHERPDAPEGARRAADHV